mmetsp:Transcript_905/g.1447  ORF Transcript_905/g.1447 Transcript_905/m.1447 type:complete len:205 (+) Transcript_905:482-1096(+)
MTRFCTEYTSHILSTGIAMKYIRMTAGSARPTKKLNQLRYPIPRIDNPLLLKRIASYIDDALIEITEEYTVACMKNESAMFDIQGWIRRISNNHRKLLVSGIRSVIGNRTSNTTIILPLISYTSQRCIATYIANAKNNKLYTRARGTANHITKLSVSEHATVLLGNPPGACNNSVQFLHRENILTANAQFQLPLEETLHKYALR